MPRDRQARVVRQAVAYHEQTTRAVNTVHVMRFINLTQTGQIGFVRQKYYYDDVLDKAYYVDEDSTVYSFQAVLTALPRSRFLHGMYGFAMRVLSPLAADSNSPLGFFYVLLSGEWDGISIVTTDPGSAQPPNVFGFIQQRDEAGSLLYEERPEPGVPPGNAYRHDWLRYRDGETFLPDARVYVTLAHGYNTQLVRATTQYAGMAYYNGQSMILGRSTDPEVIVCDAMPCT